LGSFANIWVGGGVRVGVVNTVADALVALFALLRDVFRYFWLTWGVMIS